MDAVEYFRFVRDIPFKIPLSAHEPDYTCRGKHIVLKALLSSLGLKVRYAFCEWLWSSLDMPKSLAAIPQKCLEKEQTTWKGALRFDGKNS